jgi:hypothetical protein
MQVQSPDSIVMVAYLRCDAPCMHIVSVAVSSCEVAACAVKLLTMTCGCTPAGAEQARRTSWELTPLIECCTHVHVSALCTGHGCRVPARGGG